MLMIDGHNLIPKIPGLSLREIDDEERLLQLLQLYARLRRKTVEVFFDGAPPGQAGERMIGTVRAHFVLAGRTADEAIRLRLDGMGKSARNATVVTSDRQVQANARARHARVRTSEEFAGELLALGSRPGASAAKAQEKGHESPNTPASGVPIDEWLDLFGIDPAIADQPIPLAKKPQVKRSAEKRSKAGKPDAANETAKKKGRPYHGFQKK